MAARLLLCLDLVLRLLDTRRRYLDVGQHHLVRVRVRVRLWLGLGLGLGLVSVRVRVRGSHPDDIVVDHRPQQLAVTLAARGGGEHAERLLACLPLLLRARRQLGAVGIACEGGVRRTHGHGEEQRVVVGGAAAEEVLLRLRRRVTVRARGRGRGRGRGRVGVRVGVGLVLYDDVLQP